MTLSVESWRRRWKKFQRMRHHRGTHHHLIAVKNIGISLVLALAAEAGLVLLIIAVGQFQLLDLRTIVSVVLPEVGVGVFLYYFLGQRHRERLGEVADMMDIYSKVSHLKVYTFAVWRTPWYYVENTTTKEAYLASDFVQKIIDEGILEPIICKNERDMKRQLRKNGTKLHETKTPSFAELSVTNGKVISKSKV